MDEDTVVFETSAGVKVVPTFDAMGIREELLRGIYQYGFEKPSAIQQRAVLPIVSGRDVIAQAQSGTGKTSMIAITLCQMLDINSRECVHREEAGGRAGSAAAAVGGSPPFPPPLPLPSCAL